MKNIVRNIFILVAVCATHNLAAMNVDLENVEAGAGMPENKTPTARATSTTPVAEIKHPLAVSNYFFNEYRVGAERAGEADPELSAIKAFEFAERNVTAQDIDLEAYRRFIAREELCPEEMTSVFEVAQNRGARHLQIVLLLAAQHGQLAFIRHMAKLGYEQAQETLQELEEDLATGIRSNNEKKD